MPSTFDRGNARKALPFAAASVIGLVTAALPPQPTLAHALAAAGLVAVLAYCAVSFRWAMPPAPASVLLPLAFLLVVALLREGVGGSISGFAPLLLLPVFWVALYGSRWQLSLVLGGVGILLLLPITGLLGGAYHASDARNAILWLIASSLIGFTAQNLVGRERAQRSELAEQRDFLDAMFTSAGALVAVLDTDGRVVTINPACERLGGFERGRFEGKPFWQVLLTARQGALTARRWRTLPPEQLLGETESSMVASDGTEHLIHWTLAPLRDRNGRIANFVATGLDVTEERRAKAALAESEYRFRTLVNSLPGTAIALYDRELRCLTVEGSVLAEQELGASEFEGRLLGELIPPENEAAIRPAMEAALDGQGSSFEYESHRNGRVFEVEAVPYRREGAVEGAFMVSRDITRRRRAEAEVRAAEQRFVESFEHAPVGMEMLDLDGCFVGVNEALEDLTGYPADELVGRSTSAITHRDDVAADERLRGSLLAGEGNRYDVEKRMIHADGHEFDVAVHLSLVRTADGVPRYFVGQVVDITERKRLERELKHMAEHDSLTGLLNRRRIEEEVQRHLTHISRYGRTGALLVLDVDGFKSVNDTLGHARGDELIVDVARTLDEELRGSDEIGRLGGDEFAILLPEADREEAEAVAAKLVASMRGRGAGPGAEPRVAISVGVTVFAEHEYASAEEPLIDADMAMYEAKAGGGDRFHLSAGAQPRSSSRR